MNHQTVDTRKPLPPSSVLTGDRRLRELCFVAGIAIAIAIGIGGAGLSLSDLIHLVPSLS